LPPDREGLRIIIVMPGLVPGIRDLAA
jgi:hypothetical protein